MKTLSPDYNLCTRCNWTLHGTGFASWRVATNAVGCTT